MYTYVQEVSNADYSDMVQAIILDLNARLMLFEHKVREINAKSRIINDNNCSNPIIIEITVSNPTDITIRNKYDYYTTSEIITFNYRLNYNIRLNNQLVCATKLLNAFV